MVNLAKMGKCKPCLEEAGIEYAGSGVNASRLCMNKVDTKAIVAANCGFEVAEQIIFTAGKVPSVESVIERLGEELVVKPLASGSSVGLFITSGQLELADALQQIQVGQWMIEQRIEGREMTIGLLNGEAMGVVEIKPTSGVFDYHHKYTSGASEYLYPAKIETGLEAKIKKEAEQAYRACGCRDFARLDFIVTDNNKVYFLEINTIPGLTETSLLPKSASCLAIDFSSLAKKMVAPAINRFKLKPQAIT